MDSNTKVKIEKVDDGYIVDIVSNFVDGKPTRYETSTPKTFYEAREIIDKHGVMPNKMKGLSDEEKRMIIGKLERLSRSFDAV